MTVPHRLAGGVDILLRQHSAARISDRVAESCEALREFSERCCMPVEIKHSNYEIERDRFGERMISSTEFGGRFFDLADVQILRAAFEDTCHALRFVFLSAKEDSTVDAVRREAAVHVMEALASGERHPKKISELAISRMSPKQATW